MKKKIIIATLIICVVFCMLLSHKEYRNYKITNITLSEIVIKDSLLNLRKGIKGTERSVYKALCPKIG